jgi:MFS family permease
MTPEAGEQGGFLTALRVAPVRAIWVSLLASSIGDWAARLALSILVLDRTGSAALSALVLAVSSLPWIGPGQVLATRVGHLRRVPVMVTADLSRAVVFAVLLIRLPVGLILVLAFVAALATPPFETARSALTVEVAPEEVYGRAIALLDLTDQAAIVLGYLVGGLVVAAGGYRIGLVVDIGSYLVSAGVLSRVKETRRASSRESTASQLRRGVGIIWSERVIRRSLGVVAVAALGVASVEATAAAYARLVLHAGSATAGQLAAAVPLGVIAAIPFLPKGGSAARLLRVAGAVQVIGGAVGAIAFGAGHYAGALVGFFGAGLLTGSVTPAQVAFQPRVPQGERPAVYSVAQGLAVGGQAVAAALGGLLASAIGPRSGAIVWMAFVAVAGSVIVLLPPPRVGSPSEGLARAGEASDDAEPTGETGDSAGDP